MLLVRKPLKFSFPFQLHCIYLFILDTPCSMWYLSSLTRDRTPVPLQWEHGVLTTGPPEKSSAADRLRPIDPKLKDLAWTLSRSRLYQPFSQIRRQKGKGKVGRNQSGKEWNLVVWVRCTNALRCYIIPFINAGAAVVQTFTNSVRIRSNSLLVPLKGCHQNAFYNMPVFSSEFFSSSGVYRIKFKFLSLEFRTLHEPAPTYLFSSFICNPSVWVCSDWVA